MSRPVFSDQPAPVRVYAVACPECGWETDVSAGRVMPDHTVRRMKRTVRVTSEWCPGSGQDGERVA